MLSVDDISKTYPPPLRRLRQLFGRPAPDAVEALRGVSFRVAEGEIFGLIGPNGAGKTTLTKIIATLVQPSSGAVTVRGFDSVRDEEQVRRQVGLATAEERSFYWRLTAEQNLQFFARLYALPDDAARTRIRELFALLDLGPVGRRRFGELSTGNKQRLAVARALLARPPLLLLDEPTRSLDPLAAADLRRVIASLARADPPATVLLTSHNLAEIEELCRRVAVIGGGRIRALDTPANLRRTTERSERVTLIVEFRGGAKSPDGHLSIGEQLTAVLRGGGDNDGGGAAAMIGDAEVKAEEENEVAAALWRIVFRRDPGDDRLARALRALHHAGAAVRECETEGVSLFDVLDTYRREAAPPAEAK